jgi:hypothetical protein
MLENLFLPLRNAVPADLNALRPDPPRLEAAEVLPGVGDAETLR